MQHGWSLKHLHRVMVLSKLYRRSSSNAGAAPGTLAADPDNACYWRMNPRRLESQAVARCPAARCRASRSAARRPERRSGKGGVQPAPRDLLRAKRRPRAPLPRCVRQQQRARMLPAPGRASCRSRRSRWPTAELTRECADAMAKRAAPLADPEFIEHAFLSLLSRVPTAGERTACLEGPRGIYQAQCLQRPHARCPGADEPQRLCHPPMTPDSFAHHFLTRRGFLDRLGTGLAGIALQSMFAREGRAAGHGWKPPTGQPFFPPKAKRVIWLFMRGGVSHMESFDPKPMLTKYAGKIHRRDALQGRAVAGEAQERARGRGQRRQRPAAQCHLSAANRLEALRPVRRGNQRLVPAHRLLRRRHRVHPQHVDDRRQSRRAGRSSTAAATCSTRASRRSARG